MTLNRSIIVLLNGIIYDASLKIYQVTLQLIRKFNSWFSEALEASNITLDIPVRLNQNCHKKGVMCSIVYNKTSVHSFVRYVYDSINRRGIHAYWSLSHSVRQVTLFIRGLICL